MKRTKSTAGNQNKQLWEEKQMIENLKLYSEGIQLMRHQSDNKFQDSPKITKNREQYQVSTYTGFLTGVENMKGGHGGGGFFKI